MPSPLANSAKRAGQRLRIQPPGADKTPKVGSLAPEEAVTQAVAYEDGNVALGEAIFMRASCAACHTVHESEPQKGPFLGSIANIYRRNDLAEAIALHNKTIAQGFATNVFQLKNGQSYAGFVTKEAEATVTLRDVSSAEHSIQKADIATRSKLPTSMMPPALMNSFSVHEFASLLDYLEHLVK